MCQPPYRVPIPMLASCFQELPLKKWRDINMWKHTGKQDLSRAARKAAREKNSMSENSQGPSAEQPPMEPAGTSNRRPHDRSQLRTLNTEEKPHVSAARDERKWG